VLVLASFVVFGIRVAQTAIPAGVTTEQLALLTQKYGLDRPIIEQYQWFLLTFLPGLTLLGIYATIGFAGRGFNHWILVKIFIVLMLVTNTVTILNFLVTAHISAQDTLWAFWTALVVAFLSFSNFIFLLIVWNGYRWSVWAFGITSFVVCTLKFVGHVPVFPVLFELSSVIILIYLLRSSWYQME